MSGWEVFMMKKKLIDRIMDCFGRFCHGCGKYNRPYRMPFAPNTIYGRNVCVQCHLSDMKKCYADQDVIYKRFADGEIGAEMFGIQMDEINNKYY